MSPERQLDRLISKYTPEIGGLARAALAKLSARVPGAVQAVYDNYNALAIGFGPSERGSDAILSIVLYPKWVRLFFLQGKGLPDPEGLLEGEGKVVRSIVVESPADLDQPAVVALIEAALEHARTPIDATAPSRLVIKSISAKQRPRRPAW